ncbi:MAG: extracellular solute-binding protein [Thermomicrobiales bacterium]
MAISEEITYHITTKRTTRRRFAKGLAATPLLLGAASRGVSVARAQDKVKLVLLTHWGTQEQKEPLDKIIAEYQQKNPNVNVEHQTVAFDDLLNRITTGQLGGEAPDIYHFYNLWLPDFAGSDLLAAPTADVNSDITGGYGEGTVGGASFNNQVWGYPTEVNDYQLIYNKKMFQAAEIAAPPTTPAELRDAAKKLTKKGADGKVTQAGFLFLAGWDSGVVHPWTSMLWSDGGQYVADDYSKALFNEQPGIDTLQAQLDIINDGSAILGKLEDTDFESGRVAMTIMANWWGATLRASKLGMENVGVAQIPHGEGGTPVALQYEWLWGVGKTSQHSDEAWAFLKWLNSPRDGAEASSPMGEFLTSALNAIPGRESDQKAHADILSDPFVKPFVDAFATSRSEPIIPGAQEIKTALQKQIEAAWYGQKSPTDALKSAADDANRILKEKAGS